MMHPQHEIAGNTATASHLADTHLRAGSEKGLLTLDP
jgi:hypothetical protein